MTRTRRPPSRWAEEVYRRALRLLPASLDAEFQRDALEMFRDSARVAREEGGGSRVARTLVRALLDLATQSVAARRQDAFAPAPALSVHKESLMSNLVMDVRYAVRRWRHAPVFALTGTLTLALGIGLAAAMFSVIEGVLIRPLPFHESDRLVMIWDSNLERNRPRSPTSPANLFEWRRAASGFSALSAYANTTATLASQGDPSRLDATMAYWNLFDVLGTPPALGRTFLESESVSGQDRVVVISHRVWSARFGRDPGVVGRTVTINDQPRRIVGVLPQGFALSPASDLWLPLTFDFNVFEARGARFISVIGRLAGGSQIAAAQSQMDALSASLAAAHPVNRGWRAVLVPIREQMFGSVQTPLVVLAVAVGLVMLIACANVLNLHIAHSSTRQRELALRRALGASPARLVRQLLIESTLQAILGAAAGLGVAFGLTKLVGVLNPGTLPRAENVGVDAPMAVFALALAVVAGLAMGAVAAFQVLRSNRRLRAGLADGVTHTGARTGRRLRDVVVATEVALAVVLLASWGLVGRSLVGLLTVDPGFDPAGLVAGTLAPPASRYPDTAARAAFFDRVTEHLRGVPGIDRVSVTTRLPMTGSTSFGYVIDRQPLPPMNAWTPGQLRAVDPDYFETMRIPLTQGRLLGSSDDARNPAVVVINATMARDLNLGPALLGTKIRISSGDVMCPCEIVGVVADVRENGLDEGFTPVYYLPQAQSIWTMRSLVVRSTASTAVVASAMRGAVSATDPAIPLYDVQPISRIIDRRLALPRFNAWLLGVFAALALVLASLGIYGVTSFVVSQRMPELSVRMALGSTRAGLVWLVERQAMLSAGVGLLLGIIGALAAARFLGPLLVNTSTVDPWILAGTVGVLGVLSAGAALLPALRAGRIDANSVLRQS